MGATTQDQSGAHDDDDDETLALVLAWSREEPERVGELVRIEADDRRVHLIGREGDAIWWRVSGASAEERPPLASAKLSRQQLRVERVGGALSLENIGRAPMIAREVETRQVTLRPGDSVTIEGVLVLACVVCPPLDPDVSLRPEPAELQAIRTNLALLTRAERVVLTHVALNRTSKEIAKALFVSVRTVQNHRARICEKLGLRGHNRLLAVAMALDLERPE